jgi:hypothetical protein
MFRTTIRRLPGKRRAFSPAGFWALVLVAVVSACSLPLFPFSPACATDESLILRVSNRRTGVLYAEAPARVDSRLFFGWIHSLEKFPWNEYYHVDAKGDLVLDAITFPAFGAGVPEDAGRVCYVRDGLIHMEEIGRVFTELVWLNSHSATRDITLDGKIVTRGSDLPHHTEMRLCIEKGEPHGTR